ncbi:hypothetical protein SC09_contig4orf01010 [Bacillus subtilis]|uniref:Uncharacterized protein n=1 Tax=Bacillus subtilis TaxID=1423 RepID=A0A0D1J1D5_BACIU|nr:hypothetical protein SC09_contig4orf01010 [Bacillus subtilis]
MLSIAMSRIPAVRAFFMFTSPLLVLNSLIHSLASQQAAYLFL